MGCRPFPLVADWLMDLRPQRPRFREFTRMPSIPLGTNEWYPWDALQVDVLSMGPPNITYGERGDGVCALNSWPVINITNPFVEAVRRSGLNWANVKNLTVGGRQCRLWASAELPGWGVCLAEAGEPVLYGTKGFVCTFSDFAAGPIPDEDFEQTKACQTYPTPPCPNKHVVNLTLYRLHSGSEPLELDNRDLSDLLGAPSIVCDWQTSGQTYVTSFAVTANASWGQYGRCHYNGTNWCDASTGRQVGRQAPQGMPGVPLQGQCSGNADRGSWYSFPADGKCLPGEEVGSRGCTWRARPLRTVKASCVEKAKFRAACQQEIGHGVYQPKSAAIIQRAFASRNPLRGGCPDAGPGGQAEDVIVV